MYAKVSRHSFIILRLKCKKLVLFEIIFLVFHVFEAIDGHFKLFYCAEKYVFTNPCDIEQIKINKKMKWKKIHRGGKSTKNIKDIERFIF